MDTDPDLVDLLAKAEARVVAFDPQGGTAMPLPEVFSAAAATLLEGDSPLDRIATESQSRAVVAFEHARRHGRGAAMVSLAGEHETCHLEVFDLERSHGCFIAVVTPNTSQQHDHGEATDLAPRQSHYELNVTGVIQTVGPEFLRMFGWREDDLIGNSSLDFVHPDDHESGIVGWIELLERPGGQVRLRQRLKKANGDWVWCELTETNLLDDPTAGCVRSEIVDVSRELAAQAALQRREQLLDRLSQALPTGVLQLDRAGAIAVRNDRWVELTGSSDDRGIAPLLESIVDPDPVELAVAQAMEQGIDADLAITFNGGGICRFGELHLRPLSEDGEIAGLLLTLDDVTKLQAHQLELAEQARRDPLTGTYNRLGIEEIILSRLLVDRKGRSGLIVLFLDLDRFKIINDSHGHVVGDQVLCATADCIRRLVRPTDQLGRFGGDEFLVILSDDTPIGQAKRLAARIQAALPSMAERFNRGLNLGVSIGIAEAGADDDFDSLIKRADAAMYAMKSDRAGGLAPTTVGNRTSAKNAELPPA